MIRERKKAAVSFIIAALLMIAVTGMLLPGVCKGDEGVYVQSYRADLYLDGTLDESFVYKIAASDKYRMLYRNWKMPLSLESLDRPFVRVLSISGPPECIPYVKGRTGEVWQLMGQGDLTSEADIKKLAYDNEAGIYRPGRFPSGIYQVNYTFQIHPPLEVDEKHCHWNLRLADEHLPYRHFTIAVHDPSNLVERLFPYPSTVVRREADSWIMEGSSPKDGLLEVEMLLKANATTRIEGFPESVSDAEGKTLAARSRKPMQTTKKIEDASQGTSSAIDVIIIVFSLMIIAGLFLILGGGNGGSGGHDWSGGESSGGEGGGRDFGGEKGSGGGGGGAR